MIFIVFDYSPRPFGDIEDARIVDARLIIFSWPKMEGDRLLLDKDGIVVQQEQKLK